jgi:aconitate hydratase
LPALLDSGFSGGRELVVRATDAGGKTKEIRTVVRIDTPQEITYYQHGGILHFVLRQLAGTA